MVKYSWYLKLGSGGIGRMHTLQNLGPWDQMAMLQRKGLGLPTTNLLPRAPCFVVVMQVYYVYGFMLLVVLILMIVTASVSGDFGSHV